MNKEVYEFTKMMQLGDKVIHLPDTPWIQQSERLWFKPVRFNLSTGSWINLIKVAPGGPVTRHRHSGGAVMGYTIQGEWRYLERDWVARPGTFIFEPPGDLHTLVVDGPEEMITLFFMEGIMEHLDENDNIIGQDDVYSKLKIYLDYCKEHNITPLDIVY